MAEKAPFGILVEAVLRPGTTLAARDAARQIVSSLRSANSDTKYWGYETATGSGNKYVVFAPFGNYEALGQPTTARGLTSGKSASGGLDVNAVLTSLDAQLESVERSVLEYVPALSNPPTDDAPAPGPHIFHVKAVLAPGSTLRARDLAARVAEAHRKSSKGIKYWGFSTSVGTRSTYHVAIPFSNYGDIDAWATTGAVLAETEGAQADALLTELDSLIESTERAILDYVPSLSIPA